jgi:hypothetical protein
MGIFIDPTTAVAGCLLALVLSTVLFVFRAVRSLPHLDKASFSAAPFVQLLAVSPQLPMLTSLCPSVQGVIAFFHPFADGGGGGERVLW